MIINGDSMPHRTADNGGAEKDESSIASREEKAAATQTTEQPLDGVTVREGEKTSRGDSDEPPIDEETTTTATGAKPAKRKPRKRKRKRKGGATSAKQGVGVRQKDGRQKGGRQKRKAAATTKPVKVQFPSPLPATINSNCLIFISSKQRKNSARIIRKTMRINLRYTREKVRVWRLWVAPQGREVSGLCWGSTSRHWPLRHRISR